ncbi:MAG: hypothetical protein HQK58_05460 [Deltaproteobacteria bacterium]|nr:hypothetical protein [Deltaproteobacteria bacterium]
MFVNFFYMLKEAGVPVSPTSFLRLQKALNSGMVTGVDDLYISARAILVKSERYFDIYDQLFAHYFKGVELVDLKGIELDEMAKALLHEWLNDPPALARALGVDEETLAKMTPEELINYFLERLKDQTEAHHGGHKWIGTHGFSPVGHSGTHPGGMRVGGRSMNKSAIKVAMERRYRDYSQDGPLTQSQMGEALKRLRRMVPEGPKDQVNVDETIRATLKNAGEIEIIFDRSLRDRLKVILMIDNGGWSMDPYIEMVQVLFNYARAQFKDVKSYFFHNTIYGHIWADASRRQTPVRLEEFAGKDPETRLVVVGDASMAPYELRSPDGSIYVNDRSGRPSEERLQFLADTFRHSVWLNPVPATQWPYTWTIGMISSIFPMFELTLDGLDRAVSHLMSRN